MYYRMILTEWEDPDDDLSRDDISYERGMKFGKLYRKHGVEVVGMWTIVEEPPRNLLITKYRDRQHYEEFTRTMQADPDYQKYSKIHVQHRRQVTSRELIVSPLGEVDFNKGLMDEYVSNVRKALAAFSRKR